MDTLDEIEALLVQCEKDVVQLKAIHDAVKTIEDNRQQLAAYYENDYPKDYDQGSSNAKHYRILDQDSIWNTLTEQYDEKIKLLKTLVQSI